MADLAPSLVSPDTRPKVWGHRICTPEDTLQRLDPHLSVMGITRLADITGLDRIGIPVVQAIRPLGRSLSVSQGKGLTQAAATASAAMEATEGWHAENLEGPFVQKPWRDIQLDGLPMSAPPEPQKQLTALSSHDIVSNEEALLPIDLIGKDYTVPAQHEGFHRTTNGLASGNNKSEAIVAGLHEVIERDCLADFAAMSAAERTARLCPAAMLDAINGEAQALLDQIAAANFHIFVHDITNDIGVPTMRATLFSVDTDIPGKGRPRAKPAVGSGCHLDPTTALIRAITEAAQSRLTCIAGARDDLADSRYDTVADGNLGRLLHIAADLQSSDGKGSWPANLATSSSQEDLEVLTRKLTAAGLEKILVVNLSRDDFPINVVRVLVPGLGYLTSNGPARGNRYRSEVQ